MSARDMLKRTRKPLLALTEATATMTAGARMRPDFLIVGAQRCGTTSMFKTLAQHPTVAVPFLRKGVHYFDMHYDRGMPWYQGHFPIRATSALRRRGGPRPVTGESSPFYSFHPLAAERIARDLPGIKLIMLLRDPVERAYSAHSHELARGFETEPFERAIALEAERLAGQRERMIAEPSYVSFDLQHHGYLTRGHYVDQVRRIEALVGRERLHVVDAQDFFERPESEFRGVLDFLGLPWVDGVAFEKHNARRRSPMDAALRAELTAHFEASDAALAQWWGRTPSWMR
ncbi:sulfotransferase [Actinotalea sp.]|uniref:sulfotransferase family protein n=1 Tax=Actinotalea sp. TaxID=1872145 RepID=UPI002BDC46F4|nr:sulfotransferase [Actinotalea sp.]HRA49958.1 sulfotransferase [Actinotalea sp.]